jgi:2,4-dichlorophenol 6-monooxygenase
LATKRVPVVIVGGGVAGLASSIFLSNLGVEHVLVERRRTTTGLPKAHIISAKTMEIFRQLGLDDVVYEWGSPLDNMTRVSVMTSLAGPSPLHGREIGHFESWGGENDRPRYTLASPCPYTNMPQTRLEPLLHAEAIRRAPGRIHHGTELTSITQSEHSVHAALRDLASGQEWSVEADYAIAADGGRTVGPQIGVQYFGEQDIGRVLIVHISCDLHRWVPDPRVWFVVFVNPDNPGGAPSWAGGLIKMGPHRWGNDSEEWVCHIPLLPGAEPDLDEAAAVDRIRGMLGLPDIEPIVHSVNRWSVAGVVADRLHVGRIVITGDAAHRHPPTGGLGLNSAIGDAHNVTWKLAQILRGNAAPSLLESYETERKVVAELNVTQSMVTLRTQFTAISDALGGLQSGEAGWRTLEHLFADTPEAEALRLQLQRMFVATEFSTRMLGVELGYHYHGSAVVPDGTERPPRRDPVRDYVPTTRPGHRLPHAWLDRGSDRISTVDLARLDRFVLVTDPASRAEWLSAIAAVAKSFKVPIDLVTIGPTGDYGDPTGDWAQICEIEDGGAVLIRPDSFVGWRVRQLPDDPTAELLASIQWIMGHAGIKAPHEAVGVGT